MTGSPGETIKTMRKTAWDKTNPLPLAEYLKPQIDKGEIVEDGAGRLMGCGPNGEPRLYFINCLDQIRYATEEGGKVHSVLALPPREGWRRVQDGID